MKRWWGEWKYLLGAAALMALTVSFAFTSGRH